MIRTDIHYITRCLSVHACMSVRPAVCLNSISNASYLAVLHRYINFIHHLITNTFALIFTAQHWPAPCSADWPASVQLGQPCTVRSRGLARTMLC